MSYQIRYQFRTKMLTLKTEIIPRQRRDQANHGRAQTLASDCDAENSASVHWCQIESRRQSFG